MAALTQDRNTPRAEGELRQGGVAAATLIYAGALVMRNAAGVGRAEARVDNSAGSAGDAVLTYRPGIYRFANSGGADEITVAEIGDVVFAVDDQTVAKTDGAASRSPAGHVDAVDAQGVWVRLDEALTKAS